MYVHEQRERVFCVRVCERVKRLCVVCGCVGVWECGANLRTYLCGILTLVETYLHGLAEDEIGPDQTFHTI